VVAENVGIARAGYDIGGDFQGRFPVKAPNLAGAMRSDRQHGPRHGRHRGGVKFYAAYPMSP